jgi:hypothetical protein
MYCNAFYLVARAFNRKLDQQFKAKLACVPALIKEVNSQAFSPQWTGISREPRERRDGHASLS